MEPSEALNVCCTFVLQKNNKKANLERIELSPSQKNKWEDDWTKYWFYAKIGFSRPKEPSEVYYPLASGVEMFEHTCQPGFSRHSPEFKSCLRAFVTASRVCGGRDLVEEFVVARIWPLTPGWYSFGFQKVKFDSLSVEIDCFVLGLKKPNGVSDHSFVSEVERDARNLLGPWNRKEHAAFLKICKHGKRVNRCFAEMKVSYEARVVPPPPIRWVRGVGNVWSELPAKVKGKGKAKGDSFGVKPVSEGEATSKPSTRAPAKSSSTKAAVSRVEKRKRKSGDTGANPVGTSASGMVSFMEELWKTEGRLVVAVRVLFGQLMTFVPNMLLCVPVPTTSWAS